MWIVGSMTLLPTIRIHFHMNTYLMKVLQAQSAKRQVTSQPTRKMATPDLLRQ
jgi:hypothetical protein